MNTYGKLSLIIIFISCASALKILPGGTRTLQPRPITKSPENTYSFINLSRHEVRFFVDWGEPGGLHIFCSNDIFIVPANKKVVFANFRTAGSTYFDHGKCYIKSLRATVIVDPQNPLKNINTNALSYSWKNTFGEWLVRPSKGSFVLENSKSIG